MIDINYTRMSNINNCNMKKIECVIMDWAVLPSIMDVLHR